MSFLGDLWNWFKVDIKPVPTPTPPTPVPVPENDYRKVLLSLHNGQRKSGNALSHDSKLTTTAQLHAEWMAINDNMSHNEGRITVADRAKAQGYAWNYVGENIAMGYPDAKSVFQGWMKSPGHKANILNKNYQDVGFGLAKSSHGSLYWCAVFGRKG